MIRGEIMKKLVMNGGKVLKGSRLEIKWKAKNASVAILPTARILGSEGKCVIENIPDI